MTAFDALAAIVRAGRPDAPMPIGASAMSATADEAGAAPSPS